MERKIIIDGEPTGKGRPRFSRNGHAYTPDKTVMYENNVRFAYLSEYGRVKFPETAQLRLEVLAFFGIAKSDSKKKRAAKLANEIRPTKKPDMDNIVKAIADGLNNIAYHDDAQIVECSVEKYFSEEPRVEVTIREV